MVKNEELIVKIITNFNNEVNSIVTQLTDTNTDNLRSGGVLFCIQQVGDILAAAQKGDLNTALLLRLKEVIEEYTLKFKHYYSKNALATGYVFLYKESLKFEEYVNRLSKYSLLTKNSYLPYHYIFTGSDLISKPETCAIKYTCFLQNKELKIEQQYFPDKETEARLKEAGFSKLEWVNTTYTDFYEFCEAMKLKHKALFDSFHLVMQLINNLLREDLEWRNKITRIYDILSPSFINSNPEEFFKVIGSRSITYEGKKLEWFGTKYELYFFMLKFKLSILNVHAYLKWAENRFFIKTIREDRLAKELGKIGLINIKYDDMVEALKPDDVLSLLEKELEKLLLNSKQHPITFSFGSYI